MHRYFLFALFLLILALLNYCQSDAPFPNPEVEPGESKERALARVYCASCHAFPEPDLLDRPTWEKYVLPRMGYMLGHYDQDNPRDSLLEKGPGGRIVERAQVFPDTQTIDKNTWATIQKYYLDHAPSLLATPDRQPVNPKHPLLNTIKPLYQLSPPSTTLLQIDSTGFLYAGDANTQALYLFDKNLGLVRAARTREGAVDLEDLGDRLLVTVMGSFSPTDAPSGLLLELPLQSGKQPRILLERLQRPVHTSVGDLDNDGRFDLVICEFAKWTGQLAWWQQQPNGQFRPHILRDSPGAIATAIRDLNKDGLPDILALFGQGDEGISAFLNEGGRFREKKLLRFPPSWGSSGMRLHDWDHDGDEDIIYTNGDNADYPPVLKPYHGIRVFEQISPLDYRETWFYPLPGAYDAIPFDIDLDGDLDIAAISFFPDFQKNPEEAFLLLENNGGHFTAYSIPEVQDGRWIRLAAGDIDQDGDTDLAIGSLAFEVVPPTGLVQQWVNKGIPFLVLENQAVQVQ